MGACCGPTKLRPYRRRRSVLAGPRSAGPHSHATLLRPTGDVDGAVVQLKATVEDEQEANSSLLILEAFVPPQQSAPAALQPSSYEPTQDQLKHVELMGRAGAGLDAKFAKELLEVASARLPVRVRLLAAPAPRAICHGLSARTAGAPR